MREPTERQRAFVRAVLDPKSEGKRGSLTDAWEGVYGTAGSRRNRTNQASRDWRNPCVVAEAERQRARIDAARCRAVSGDRQRIRERLWAEAAAAARSSDRIAALRLVAEIAAALSATNVSGDVSGPDDAGPEVDPEASVH